MRQFRSRIPSQALAPVALLLVTLLAAALRFWELVRVPPGFHHDEAFQALEALKILAGPGYRPVFLAGNFGVPPFMAYLTSVAFGIFGARPEVMRGVSALLGTLTVPLAYLLTQEIGRNSKGLPRGVIAAAPLLAAACLAILRWHITYSRVGIEPFLVPLFLCLMLWAFWAAWRTNRLSLWAALGLFTGLSLYTYQVAWLLPFVLVMVAGIAALGDRGRVPSRLRGIGLAVVVALLVAFPLLVHLAQNPQHLFPRSAPVLDGPGGAAKGSLGQNLVATLGMLNISGDRDPRNNLPGTPALDPLLSLPFILALVLAIRYRRQAAFSTLPLVLLAMMVPSVLGENAQDFRRAIGATLPLAVLCGAGLAWLLGWGAERVVSPPYLPQRLLDAGFSAGTVAGDMDRLRKAGRIVVVAVILAASTAITITTYFTSWGQSRALYYAYDQGLWEIGRYLHALPAGAAYVSPRPQTDMTLAFALRERPAVRYFDGRHAFVTLDRAPVPQTYVIIEREDFRGSRVLRELYPAATEERQFLDRAGEVFARVFRVPPGTAVARGPRRLVRAGWDGIELLGYDASCEVCAAGSVLLVQNWWRAAGQVPRNGTVFVHLLGPAKADGSIMLAGADSQPGGRSVPTTTWRPGELILDEYVLQIPPDAPAGEYQIELGLYDLNNRGVRAVTVDPAGQDHAVLGTVTIE